MSRWLILGLLAAVVGTALLIFGQQSRQAEPLPQPPPEQHAQAAPQRPPPQTPPPRGAERPPPASHPAEASAGSSGPPNVAAATAAAGGAQGGPDEPVLRKDGNVAYYADTYQGRTTASGEPMNQDALTAASHALPLGARVTVVRPATGKSVEVTVNDRGPHVEGRIMDLSKKAAEQLDLLEEGVAPARLEARPSQQPTPELARKIAEEAHAAQAR
jgi:rare lipoprotein A